MKIDIINNGDSVCLKFTRESDGQKRNVSVSASEFLDKVLGLVEGNGEWTRFLDVFQKHAMSTRTAETLGDARYIYPALGMNGEAGEVAEKVKKVIRDKKSEWDDETKRLTALEVFDVIWYCIAMLQDLEYDFSQVARMGLDKLCSRKQRNVLHGSGDER